MLSSFPAKPAVKSNCNEEDAETLPPQDLIPRELLFSPCVGTVAKKLVYSAVKMKNILQNNKF